MDGQGFGALRGWLTLGLLGYTLGIGGVLPASAVCGGDDERARSVVLLSACEGECRPKGGTQCPRTFPACGSKCEPKCKGDAPSRAWTGVLVSRHGLVLTAFKPVRDLLEEIGLGSGSRENTADIEKLRFTWAKKKGDKGQDARAITWDPRHTLLLIKIAQDDLEGDGGKLGPARIGDFFLAYLRDHVIEMHPVGYRAGTKTPIGPKDCEGGVDILDSPQVNGVDTNFKFEQEQIGGPVFNGEGELVAIISGYENANGDRRTIIPIEYADVLLPKVFISEMGNEISERLTKLEARGNTSANICAKWTLQRGDSNAKCKFPLTCSKDPANSKKVAVGEFTLNVNYMDSGGRPLSTNKEEQWVEGVLTQESLAASSDPLRASAAQNSPEPESNFCLDDMVAHFENLKTNKRWKAIGVVSGTVKLYEDDAETQELKTESLNFPFP